MLQSTTTMAITAATIDQRRHCHHHYCVVVIDSGGKDAIATTTIDPHRCMAAVGSVPQPPPTTMTATLALIALALALHRTRIQRPGGGRVVTRFIHGRCGCRRWCLRLRSRDDGTEEDDCGERQGLHANNVTRGAGVSPPGQALHNADAALHGAIAAVSLHVIHIILNLNVASDLRPAAPTTSHIHGVPPTLVQHQFCNGVVAAVGEVLHW